MEKRIWLLLVVLLCINLYAQDNSEFETIRGNKDIRISGFGGPMMNFTQIGGDFVHMMGGGGGIIVNNFFFGGYGMGKTNQLIWKTDSLRQQVMEFGHGGFWMGYTAFYNKAIHPVFHTQIGWGAITKRQKNWDYDNDPFPSEIDQVFVISPTLELEMNFSRFFKLGGGVTYSFVYNTDGPYTFFDFDNPGIFVSFKFGWF